MKRLVILCSLLCVMTLGARAQNPEREIRQFIEAAQQAGVKGDKAFFERAWADNFVAVDPDGQLYPKARLLAEWQTVPASVKRTAELAGE